MYGLLHLHLQSALLGVFCMLCMTVSAQSLLATEYVHVSHRIPVECRSSFN